MKRLAAVTLALAVASTAARAEPRRLNLLLVTADDFNGDSAGWMGDPQDATPHLDQFASTAHQFVHHHLVAPLCQPSRAGLMTGLVPQRNGATGFEPVRDGTRTLVSLLHAHGYYTAVVNKEHHMQPPAAFPWDAVLSRTSRDPRLWRELLTTAIEAAGAAGKPFFVNANIRDPHRPFLLGPVTPAEAGEPAGPDDEPEAHPGHELAMPVNEAAAVPFRSFDPQAIHVPAFLDDLPEVRAELALYYSAVSRLDASFGEILATLAETGHADDTVVVFLGDNGMPFPFAKGTLFRSGTHSPLLLRWPGQGPSQRREELVSAVDLLPTLLDLLDVPAPDGLDGRSWLPLLRGEPWTERPAVFAEVNGLVSGRKFPQRAARDLDSALIFHAWSDGVRRFRSEVTRTPSYRALAAAAAASPEIALRLRQFDTAEPLMFFDLGRDPQERVNRIDEPASRAEVERLAGLLAAEMRRTGDPQLANFERTIADWRRRHAGRGSRE